MPCRDWDDSVRYIEDTESKRRLDIATRVACTAFRAMTEQQIAKLPVESRTWWSAHQEMDRRREAAEAAARKKKTDRAAALKKLTPEERKALGL